MSRVFLIFAIASWLAFTPVGNAPARAQGTSSGGNPSSASRGPARSGGGAAARQKKVERPRGLNSASEYMSMHGSSALGGGAGGGGGGGPIAKFQDPLSPDRDNPNTYANKRHPAPKLGSKSRQSPKQPQVLKPQGAIKGRQDRTFSNGIFAQSGLYNGPEGSRVGRQPDPRAELARMSAPSRSKMNASPKSKANSARRAPPAK